MLRNRLMLQVSPRKPGLYSKNVVRNSNPPPTYSKFRTLQTHKKALISFDCVFPQLIFRNHQRSGFLYRSANVLTSNTKFNYPFPTADQTLSCSKNIHLKILLCILSLSYLASVTLLILHYHFINAHKQDGIVAEIDTQYASCLIK
jgi:hypothetical protein